MTFTIEEVRDYVEGWLGAENDLKNLTINQIKAMLHNSLAMLEDDQDGIVGYIKRKRYYMMVDIRAGMIVSSLLKSNTSHTYEDILSLEKKAKYLIMAEWEENDIVVYLKCMEEYDPSLDEDIALARMKKISDKYKN